MDPENSSYLKNILEFLKENDLLVEFIFWKLEKEGTLWKKNIEQH